MSILRSRSDRKSSHDSPKIFMFFLLIGLLLMMIFGSIAIFTDYFLGRKILGDIFAIIALVTLGSFIFLGAIREVITDL